MGRSLVEELFANCVDEKRMFRPAESISKSEDGILVIMKLTSPGNGQTESVIRLIRRFAPSIFATGYRFPSVATIIHALLNNAHVQDILSMVS